MSVIRIYLGRAALLFPFILIPGMTELWMNAMGEALWRERTPDGTNSSAAISLTVKHQASNQTFQSIFLNPQTRGQYFTR